ncbi:TylF/MycF/NovP-related O-methyltransferase [Hoeflea sp. 108]|jgi:O-methyltransferase|uniref:TylF/MycF/NovP-related O-methyltransferase n=1 Tax=Hoeflea sp. 108 TaxID=1116369 RepID=UPI00035F203B|nr:TylF/MycF/NovP-related O-methyltransferase [Hoeflea sp. 108]
MLNGLIRRLTGRAHPYRELPGIAKSVMAEHLTYLSIERMQSLLSEIEAVKKSNVAGDFAEFGVALGGSAIVIASLRESRSFEGYDVFGQIPEPGTSDRSDAHSRYEVIRNGLSQGLAGEEYYGYRKDLYGDVVAAFARHGLDVDDVSIALKKGLFQDTLHPHPHKRYSLVHIDCDWHDPVYFCLKTLSPQLSSGAAVLIDDYSDYEGCRLAVDRALREDKTLKLDRVKPHAVLRKI